MARPLKIKMLSGAFAGLQEMTNSELDYVAHLILKKFATSSGTGELSINDTNGGATVGTFTDTSRPGSDVGEHPIGTNILSTSYTFRQDLTTITPSTAVRPFNIKYNGAVMDGLQEMSNLNIISGMISRVKAKLALKELGTYKLAASNPGGGTWVSKGTVSNDIIDAGNTTQLWLCTAPASTPTAVRPVEWNGTGLQEMSDTQIELLTDYFRQEIVDTGIGNYHLTTADANATLPGTWVIMGNAFDDTRRQAANQTYNKPPGSAGYFYGGNNAYVGFTVLNGIDVVTDDIQLWMRTA